MDAKDRGMVPDDLAAIVAKHEPTPEPYRPHQPPKYRVIAGQDKPTLRVLAIGDSHDHPAIPDKSRFALMGRHASAERFDIILHIGDWLDMHSLCFHTRDETYKGRQKPTVEQDLRSGAESMAAFEAELTGGADGWRPRKHIVLGNHEDRAHRYEDQHPAMMGQITGQLENIFESHGWTHQKFGHWTMAGGVGFTHVPRTIMGRPVGGKTVENTLANDTTFDIVFGHTHRHNFVKRAKHGYSNSVRVLNLGSSMPPGYVAEYADGLPTGYDYGVVDMVIFDGAIQSAAFRSWRELEIRYGRMGG